KNGFRLSAVVDPATFNPLTLLEAHIHSKQLLIYEMGEYLSQTHLFGDYKWTLSRILFFLNRYVSSCTMIFNALQHGTNSCRVSPWIRCIGSNLLILVVTLTMTLRVRALWNHSRPVQIVVTLLFLGNILISFIVVGYAHATTVIVPADPPFTGCTVTTSSRFANITLIITIPSAFIFETLVIIFTVIGSYPLIRQRDIKLPLFHLLFTDGLAFYCVIMAAQLLTLICFYDGDMSVLFTVAISSPAVPVTAVASNRLLLRLQNVLVTQDVMMRDPDSSNTNASTLLWAEPVVTTDEFSVRTSHSERGRGSKRYCPLSTQWSSIALADLGDHQHQSTSREVVESQKRRSQDSLAGDR
ncbi:hypothetical protein CPB86DRAFT_783000, partial [Serendipita vermifera]